MNNNLRFTDSFQTHNDYINYYYDDNSFHSFQPIFYPRPYKHPNYLYKNDYVPIQPYPQPQIQIPSVNSHCYLTSTNSKPIRRKAFSKRSKLGCLTCRSRRIKCDELKPICTHCKKSKRECIYPDPATIKRSKTATVTKNSKKLPVASSKANIFNHLVKVENEVQKTYTQCLTNKSRSNEEAKEDIYIREISSVLYERKSPINIARQSIPNTGLITKDQYKAQFKEQPLVQRSAQKIHQKVESEPILGCNQHCCSQNQPVSYFEPVYERCYSNTNRIGNSQVYNRMDGKNHIYSTTPINYYTNQYLPDNNNIAQKNFSTNGYGDSDYRMGPHSQAENSRSHVWINKNVSLNSLLDQKAHHKSFNSISLADNPIDYNDDVSGDPHNNPRIFHSYSHP